MARKVMCPHCGELVYTRRRLTAVHRLEADPDRDTCPGSQQIPRNPESDRRPLWNGRPNPHAKPLMVPSGPPRDDEDGAP